MSVALDEDLQRALGSALRALDERVALARKLRKQAIDGGHRLLAERWADNQRDIEAELEVIRSSVQRMDRLTRERAVSLLSRHESARSARGRASRG